VRGNVHGGARHQIVASSLQEIGGGLSAARIRSAVQTAYLIAEIEMIRYRDG
jgi:hypothetical protein